MNNKRLMKQKRYNFIKIKITVTSTTEPTQIISNTFKGLSSIEYVTFNLWHEQDNPIHYETALSYYFTSTGERIGYLHFKDNITDLSNLFNNVGTITYIDLNNLDTSKVTTMTGMCTGCFALKEIHMNKCSAESLTAMINMFNSCSVLTTVDFGNYKDSLFRPTSKLKDIRNMFNWCRSITSIDMSMFDLSGVTLWGFTWGNCLSLTSLYICSALNPNGTYTTNMFANSTAYGAKIYYNTRYDMSKISSVKGSNWTMIPYNY